MEKDQWKELKSVNVQPMLPLEITRHDLAERDTDSDTVMV